MHVGRQIHKHKKEGQSCFFYVIQTNSSISEVKMKVSTDCSALKAQVSIHVCIHMFHGPSCQGVVGAVLEVGLNR